MWLLARDRSSSELLVLGVAAVLQVVNPRAFRIKDFRASRTVKGGHCRVLEVSAIEW